jgi:hypothetical protein
VGRRIEMKLGTHIKMADGRIGTVVYNGLDGVGVKWGIHHPDPKDFEGSSGGLVPWDVPQDFRWWPDAILRDPWAYCEQAGWKAEQCVGRDYEIV